MSHIDSFHGAAQALHDVSFSVAPGEIVGLMGRNGAGKTTTLRTIMGLLRPLRGTIQLDNEELTRLQPHEIPRRGLAYVPQGRRLFNDMTVEENLRMGVAVRDSPPSVRDGVLQLLPILKQRLTQRAGSLSGGEQQMLALARALCAEPKAVLLDEPSEGLAPEVTGKLLDTLAVLRQRGVVILLVEQQVKSALKICDRIVLMENGAIRHEALASELAADPAPLERYIGVHGQEALYGT